MMPVMLEVSGKKCVIIGGGNAAWRKAKTLLENNADVTVISETLHENFKGMNITHIRKAYEAGDTKNSFLVIAATNDKTLNRRIKSDAENGDTKLFMSADGESSDLAFMAYTQSGDAKIAVSTNGAYPLLGVKICEKLTELCKKCGELCGILPKYRKKVLKSDLSSKEKRELLNTLISDKMLAKSKEEFIKSAEEIIGEKL